MHVMVAQAPATSRERALVARARSGDPDAFMALVEPYDRGLRGLAYRLLDDERAMEDALQTAYLNAYRSLGRFAGGASISTWLYRIAYNACLDELRRRRRAPVAVDEVARSRTGDPADVAAGRVDLAAALRALPVELRGPVLLVDGEGLTYGEAARVLGVREGTVASRLSRARGALRAALGADATEVTR